MVNPVAVFVLLALVGVTTALPRNANRVYRQSDADADAPGNTLDEEPVTLAARSFVSDDTDVVDVVPVGGDSGEVEDNELGLPSNASSIRANIVKTFSCEGRNYGYYADVDNECQIFHVCMPVALPGSRAQTFKWSFICPGETIFNQESFTCTRPEDSLSCDEAPQYYRLNDNFGVTTKPDPEFQSRSGVAAPRSGVETPGEEEAPKAPVDVEEVTTPQAEEISL